MREAEEHIVGACLDYEHALTTALSSLRVDDFRSEVAEDLRRIFYTLVGWYARGKYDPATNRDRLGFLAEASDVGEWDGYLDTLWCPWAAVPEYIEELCRVVSADKALSDTAVEAIRAWDARVFQTPRLYAQNKPQSPGKGGIQL